MRTHSWTVAATCGVVIASTVPACTSARAGLATLRVSAVLVATHLNAHGIQQTTHAPLSGKSVKVTGPGKEIATQLIDAHGNATIHLSPGQYTITTTLADACQPANIVLHRNQRRVLNLNCAAP